MSGFAPMYGRQGPKAGGDHHVAELLTRTIENQYRATTLFDDAVTSLQSSGKHPWLMPVSSLTIMHSRWLSSMLWQASTAYLDGVVVASGYDGSLSDEVYQECDSLCDLASGATMRAIQQQSELDEGGRLSTVQEAPFPGLHIEGHGMEGVWQAFGAVFLQVTRDMHIIENFDLPRQMQPVWHAIRTAFKPNADVFLYLQSSWDTTVSADNRLQVLREALPVVQKLFFAGQCLWTPYLLGSVYAEALRYKPKLDELQLGFDPWILTDPSQQKIRSNNAGNREELTDFWSSVTDTEAVRRLVEQLDAALRTRRVRRRTGHTYDSIPWPSQYMVRLPTELGTRTFQPGDLIVFYSSQNEEDKRVIEIRRTGRLTKIIDLLGHGA